MRNYKIGQKLYPIDVKTGETKCPNCHAHIEIMQGREKVLEKKDEHGETIRFLTMLGCINCMPDEEEKLIN